MLSDFILVDLDAEAWQCVWAHDPALLLDNKSLLHNILPPRYVGVYRFADDVARLGETKFERGCCAHRPLRIMGRQ